MNIEQIYTGCLAQGAYYIESQGEVAVIDPLRETTPYLDRANKDGNKIKFVFETHFHADFVSGHIDLAKATGAKIIYGPGAKTSYDIYEAEDSEVFTLGAVKIKVLHTPGHTPESSCYVLYDESGIEKAIFTGDTLFIGDVGRPDLAQRSDLKTEDLAAMLYKSLRGKIMPLADDIIVYPAHGAGSACGKNMSNETLDTLGNQKQTNYALRADMSEEEFINEVTAGILPPPQYFPKNVKMNKEGYESIDEVISTGTVPLSVEMFEQVVNQHGALVIDTRDQQEFSKGFIPNAIFIGIDGSFAPWVGTLIADLKQPIVVVAGAGREEEVVLRLARVGYDNTLGYLEGGFEAWRKAGKEIDTVKSISAETFCNEYKSTTVNDILDVRKPVEYEDGHVQSAQLFSLDYVNDHMSEVDPGETYYIYCAGGYRSMITASILKSRGFDHIIDIAGGYAKIKETDIVLSN